MRLIGYLALCVPVAGALHLWVKYPDIVNTIIIIGGSLFFYSVGSLILERFPRDTYK